MFRDLQKAIRETATVPGEIQALTSALHSLRKDLQEPVALLAYVRRLEMVEAQQGAVMSEVAEILDNARKERRDARSAEERTRTREKNITQAADFIDGYEESGESEPDDWIDVPEGDGVGSEPNGVQPVRTRLEARADAKARARAHKYGS